MNITPVILCGGSGTRLWPLSRHHYPKQFLNIVGDHTLFQQTILRVLLLESKPYYIDEIIIVTNENHRFLVLEQIDNLKIKKPIRIILEPVSRNTAPALTLAALANMEKGIDSNMIVVPADHYIKNNINFSTLIKKALDQIDLKSIILLGIKPKSPNTGYGYIEYSGNSFVKTVKTFKEKPNLSQAKEFLKKGNYSWNAGIFILKTSVWLDAIEIVNKKIINNIKKSWEKKYIDQWFVRPDKISFSKSPSDSIDYSVIEKAINVNISLKLIILNSFWSDLGSFLAIEQISAKDKNNNVLNGDVVSYKSKNNIVLSSKRNVSLLGVADLIIIETDDSVLIANKKDIDSIKDLIKLLNKKHNDLLNFHNKIHRPWGSFNVVNQGKNFKVKHIYVKSNGRLSYQSHKFRNEHWVVVKGIATIIKNGKKIVLKSNESTYIEKGVKHQLMNESSKDLEIIEVQTGKILKETDIKRFKDSYGR